MTFKPFHRFLVILLVINLLLLRLAVAQVSNLTVSVVGAGPSYDEAKADAVKKALQYAFKQLVVVDRIVSGNDVLRDRVLSTSNGYVEKFTEKGKKKSDAGYEIDAEITVSASRIENFLGVIPSSGGKLDGPLIDQEVQRRIAEQKAVENQAKARGEIFDRLFENYPMGAVNLQLKKVTPSAKNPNILILDIEQTYRPEFIQEIEGTFRALSLLECRIPYKDFFGSMKKAFLCPYNDIKALAALIQKHAPPASGSKPRFGNVCLGDDRLKIAKCFLLDHGDYMLTKAVTNGRYQVFGKFVDASGQSALIRKRCLPVGNKRHLSEEKTLGLMLGGGSVVSGPNGPTTLWRGFILSNEKLTFQVEMDSAEVDLQRANRFVAVAGMMKRDGRIEGLTSPNQPKDPCDLVDDAARLDIIVSAGKP